ncbi:MAG: metallophosphoesterase [Actinomycetota bacterium]
MNLLHRLPQIVAALLLGVLGGCSPADRSGEVPAAGSAGGPGSACTINGTARDDVLRGTAAGDTICAGGGNDVLVGRGGKDVLIGGAGSDAGLGGGQEDSIRGGSGIDLLLGGPAADVLQGGTGDDRCTSGSGDRAVSCSQPSDAPIVAAAGDIACPPGDDPSGDLCQQRATSDLLLQSDAWAVLTLGDNQYEDGELQGFQGTYAASWGRVKAITRPSPGNHDYHVSGAAGYYAYFGPLAGDPAKGYYSFDVGAWHLIALNSNCDEVGGCDDGSSQGEWLSADLAAHASACTLAYWHHPRFTSGDHGNDDAYDAFWRILYDGGADIVLNGHDHDYERFAPQDPDQQADPNGIRGFVVGTGGKSLRPFVSAQPNSQVRDPNTFGVLELTLRAQGYDWSFVPVDGSAFADSGSGSCH